MNHAYPFKLSVLNRNNLTGVYTFISPPAIAVIK